MTEHRATVIIAYDVASNKRRRSMRAILSEWRVAGQKSVHVCWLSRERAESLFVELCAVADPTEDKLLLAFVQDVVFQTTATDGLQSLLVSQH